MELTLYFRALRRGWWLIALMMLIAVNVSLVVSYFTPPVYQTSVRFVVSPNAALFSNSWDIVSSLDVLDRRSIVNTYKELLSTPAVYSGDTQIDGQSLNSLLAKYNILVVVVPDTNILQLTIEGLNANDVVAVANTISAKAVDYINQLYPVYNFSILDKPEIPTAPIRPEPVKNAALAGLLGAIAGIVLAFSREQLQNTIEKLRERSIIDVASSAYTRIYFERKVREIMTQMPDANISIGIVNFRGLEELSDVLPSPILDHLLNTLTQTLKGELRGRDIVGRWDKTKLVVLLPSTPNSAVEATFKRIQIYLSKPLSVDKAGDMVVRPDPCIGIASRDQFETSEDLVRRADLAIERASSHEEARVIFLSKPFVFAEEINEAT